MISKIWLIAVGALLQLAISGCDDDGEGNKNFSADTVQKLDSTIATEMQTQNLPGVVVGVWAPGEGTYVVARGTANLATGRPRQMNDPFRIASISKTFIGTAILQLVDEGKLATSDKLAKWYPAFPNADRITIGDLLRMRSGIADSADQAFLEFYYDNPLTTLTAEDMINRSAARVAEFVPPDTVTKYANALLSG